MRPHSRFNFHIAQFTFSINTNMTEDDTFRILKRRITTAKEMNYQSWLRFATGSLVSDMEEWLISEGWTLEEWKQSERDKAKGLL